MTPFEQQIILQLAGTVTTLGTVIAVLVKWFPKPSQNGKTPGNGQAQHYAEKLSDEREAKTQTHFEAIEGTCQERLTSCTERFNKNSEAIGMANGLLQGIDRRQQAMERQLTAIARQLNGKQPN